MGGIRLVVYLKRELLAAGVETDYSHVAASSDYKPEAPLTSLPGRNLLRLLSVSSTNMCNVLASSQVLTESWDLLDVSAFLTRYSACMKSFGRVGE